MAESSPNVAELLSPSGPVCLIVKAHLTPVGDVARFQPAGFPEVGHVIYRAPASNGGTDDVCIVDSPASMANHLEAVCIEGENGSSLHPDLEGLPYVVCVTDRDRGTSDSPHDRVVCTSMTEGHRIASDYFLDGLLDPHWVAESSEGKKRVPAHWEGTNLRDRLRREFGIEELKKGEKYFVYPENWWSIYATVFRYDPNSLLHGVLFAKEQIKISRLLTAHLEAFGAARVGRSGVKFDRLGKTTSGQPIFSIDEETAREIRATFILDLALLRSYGRDGSGLSEPQKHLLMELALWKINRLLEQPFRYRTQCYLQCTRVELAAGDQKYISLPTVCMRDRIADCAVTDPVTRVYYPGSDLFKVSPTAEDHQADEEGPQD